MPSGSESPDLGTRVLGPHVVGQRVVVRRLVPGETGPSGGPALTDILGICLSWSADGCVVQPESGPPVTIPLALIVSGKPVPPRPSVRIRLSPREAEAHVLSLFPGVTAEPLGEWTLRHDPVPVGRPRKRSNSCLAMGDPGLPFGEAVAAVRSFYAEREREAVVQVEAESEQQAAFEAVGWEPVTPGDAHFQLASLARVRRHLGAVGAAELAVSGASAHAHLTEADAEIASGKAVLDGDWLGIHDVLVESAHRRRGHARDVLATLLEWGAEQGATTAWLHVETDNQPGLALYGSLGFLTHHTCRYLAAPQG